MSNEPAVPQGMRGRISSMAALLVGVVVAVVAAISSAQDSPVVTLHEWRSFSPGAWKRVRVLRETFDDKGHPVNRTTAETTTTLVEIDENGLKLRAEVSVEVAGRRFAPQPQEVWYGFQGQTKGQVAETSRLGTEKIELNGQKFDAQVCQVLVRDGKLERTSRLYCVEEFPHVLRRQSVLLDLSGEQPKELDRLTSELVAWNLPYPYDRELLSVAMIRTVAVRPDGKTVTIELQSPEVPGYVVAHWSTRWDAAGRIVERSVLELLDFDTGADAARAPAGPLRRPLLHRSRPLRP
ncbi:MAG: hypothetical protein KatS3mg110_1794 [Pirellulaceae bacterium]|nr:MAG: hypothetical protein KatS3mg110_1794 [Pirellulaceae bacterium]